MKKESSIQRNCHDLETLRQTSEEQTN